MDSTDYKVLCKAGFFKDNMEDEGLESNDTKLGMTG